MDVLRNEVQHGDYAQSHILLLIRHPWSFARLIRAFDSPRSGETTFGTKED